MTITFCRRRVLGGVLAAACVNLGAFAQSPPPASEPGWNVQWQGKMEVERDNNIYHLSTSQMLRMDRNDPLFQVSGRYNDMRSIEDVVIPLSVEVEASREDGLRNLPFSVQARIAYHPYARNPKRSYLSLDASAEQNVSKRGKVRVRTEYIPSLFWKNYLADAIDVIGSVNEEERIYKPAIYGQWDVSTDYKHRLKGAFKWLSARALVGYRARTYDEPFHGRNQRAVRGAVELGFDIVKGWDAEAGVEYESIASPVADEVMVLDEPDYMMDFNNDLDVADNNRRTVQRVDRSRGDGRIYIGTSFKPLKSLKVHAGYEYLRRQHNSKESLDPANKGRIDKRNSVEVRIDYHVILGLHVLGEVGVVNQRTNMPGDPESLGETLDYEVRTFLAGLMWRF